MQDLLLLLHQKRPLPFVGLCEESQGLLLQPCTEHALMTLAHMQKHNRQQGTVVTICMIGCSRPARRMGQVAAVYIHI